MGEIEEVKVIRIKYNDKTKKLRGLPYAREEDNESKLIANKTLYVPNLINLDALDLREKVNHEGSFKIFELNEKQISGSLSFINAESNSLSSNSASFYLVSSGFNDKEFKEKHDFNDLLKFYYYLKCLLSYQTPVTDILICAGLSPYRDNISFS